MDEVVLAHGTRLGFAGARLVDVIDRAGHRLAHLAWRDSHLSSAMVWGAPGAAPLGVSPALVAHPVLGPAHALSCGAVMAAIEWAAPRTLPAIDRPATLPPGAGTMLLDVVALLAEHADVETLRYHGPYPTHALWSSLGQCFRADGGVDAFVVGARVDFAPAPFERVWFGAPGAARGWVQLRDGVERVSIDGRDFATGAGARRLVRDPDDATGRVAAEFWIGDAPLARLAVFDARGEVVDGPHAPPPVASSVLGLEFPAPLRAVLAELIADGAPAPLADEVRAVIASSRLSWADLGVDLARADGGGAILVHAALWERLAPLGMARLGLALAEAIEPIARALAAAALVARVVPPIS